MGAKKTRMLVKHGLVVSCQALENEPLHGSLNMVLMAKSAQIGGAKGIRANSPQDIRAIREALDLPIIGLWKKNYPEFEIYITPTLEDAVTVHEAGADVVALDATGRKRPDGRSLEQTIRELKQRGIRVMADISTFEEGAAAAEYGADYVSTTLAGYTSYSRTTLPDLALVGRLAEQLSVPVVAEGGVSHPLEAKQALECGAYCVVVGSAITRPQWITATFAAVLPKWRETS